jgi:hypothetical protein
MPDTSLPQRWPLTIHLTGCDSVQSGTNFTELLEQPTTSISRTEQGHNNLLQNADKFL